jgi:hypothetical protein
MCDHRFEQYHGVFTCKFCKNVVIDCSDRIKLDKKEIEKERAYDREKQNT